MKTSWELFGVECEEGWRKLVEPILLLINDLNEHRPEYKRVHIMQIKEKFGGLRIDLAQADDYLFDLCDQMERLSYNVCEVCGEDGKLRDIGGSWMKTLCDTHYKHGRHSRIY